MGTMSTGLFMGVRGSYIDGAEASAEAFLDAINRALTHRGAAPYLDPPEAPNVYEGHLFGRSQLDHRSSREPPKTILDPRSRMVIPTAASGQWHESDFTSTNVGWLLKS